MKGETIMNVMPLPLILVVDESVICSKAFCTLCVPLHAFLMRRVPFTPPGLWFCVCQVDLACPVSSMCISLSARCPDSCPDTDSHTWA